MKIAVCLCLASLLAACASYDGRGLRPGVATEAEVRGLMGPPAIEVAAVDGGKHLAYPRGPLGTTTFIADVGQDGILRGVRQVLNDDTFNGIRPGLTREDVLRRIGPPGETMQFSLSGNTAWDYRFVDTWGYIAVFSVTFNPGGIVVSKISRRIHDRESKQ
jgi:hypothetical protein